MIFLTHPNYLCKIRNIPFLGMIDRLCLSSDNGANFAKIYGLNFSHVTNHLHIARKIFLIRGQTSFQVYVQGYEAK